jgi:hypothetical protein
MPTAPDPVIPAAPPSNTPAAPGNATGAGAVAAPTAPVAIQAGGAPAAPAVPVAIQAGGLPAAPTAPGNATGGGAVSVLQVGGTLTTANGTPLVFVNLVENGTNAGRPSYVNPGTGLTHCFYVSEETGWVIYNLNFQSSFKSVSNVATPNLATGWVPLGGEIGTPTIRFVVGWVYPPTAIQAGGQPSAPAAPGNATGSGTVAAPPPPTAIQSAGQPTAPTAPTPVQP